MVAKVIWVRLRFILVLVLTGLVIVKWDTIVNHWHKHTRGLWSHDGAVVEESDVEYYCPMHPSVVRPGLDPGGVVPKCPICGMPLSPRKKGQPAESAEQAAGRVQLSPERIRLAGIQTEEVTHRPLVKEISTVGYVGYDESRLSRIVARVSSYLEKLYVDRTWITVNEGDPLAEIYSPQLDSTARELLLAVESKRSDDLVKSARERMRRLGVSDAEIDGIIESGRANRRLVIRSPQSGHVIRKDVVQGDSVEAGKSLFEVADLSRIWIEADVFEKDIPFLRVGQTVQASVEALPNRMFTGKVSLVHPHLETTTRTNAVRFEVDNPLHELRPGMFATVRIEVPLSEVAPFRELADSPPDGALLAVPERAVVDTGSRKFVYVEREPNTYEAVEVELGPRAGGFYPLVTGLDPGDRVVTTGSFLIDAETRLNPAAASTYFGASGHEHHQASAASVGRSDSKTAARAKKPNAKARKNIAQLPPQDAKLALAQGICPVGGEPLGSMGVPVKMMVKGQPVFLCCKGCEAEVNEHPDEVLNKLAEQPARDDRKAR
jgi:hypothetical protein